MEPQIERPQVAEATVLLNDEIESEVIEIDDEPHSDQTPFILRVNTTATAGRILPYVYQFLAIIYRIIRCIIKFLIRFICETVRIIYEFILWNCNNCMNCKKDFDRVFMVISIIFKIINIPLGQINRLFRCIHQLAQD